MFSSGESSVANLKTPSFYMNTHAEVSGHRSRKQTTVSSSQRSIDSGFVSSSFEDRSQSSWPSNSQNGNNLWNSWNSAEIFSPNSLFPLFDNQQEAINSHSLQNNQNSPERFRNIHISQLSDSQNSNNGILHVPDSRQLNFLKEEEEERASGGILEAGVNILVYQDPQDNVHYASLLPNGRVQANVRLGPLFSSIQRWVGFCLGHQNTSRTPLFELLRVRYRNVSLFKINIILGVGLSRDEVVEQIELLRQKSLTKEITDYRDDFELNDPNQQLPVYMRSFINELLKAMPAVNNTKQNNCGRLRRSPRIRNRQQAAKKK
ncbi:Bifunctional protein PyrR [Trichinella spiralis]|uniref:Bifunctional protein PyrR n=1 Tax=Trichinella spiralis TaxID=6334 RepID=A0ABR3KXA8_TRISP